MGDILNKVRFLAVDDNLLDLLAVSEFAKGFDFLENCGTYSNPIEAYEAQQYIKPDLVFLDIEMSSVTGIELLRKIRADVPMAVFVTSYPEYALDGIDLSVLDYVLKPLTAERFALTAQRIKQYWEMRQKSIAYEVLFENDLLTIKEGYKQIRISQNDIIYLEAMQDYTKIVTENRNYMTLSTMSFFMDRLPADRFMRVHRSYAVALHHIRELSQSEVVCSNARIPVGKTYRQLVSRLQL
ncbi:LytR/AlgR family response regulator transcription factor [Dyadobacter sp. 32]|uniref:LytR/AlgR family response regulator transcription factor n=1 Tax=Dyadobacter sp. 32 TaxID=538966 RepID=UPI0011EC5F98